MALFPFVMTIVLPNSVLRNWPAWLAVYGFFSMDRWLLGHWPTTGRALEYLKITYGWCLLLIVVMMVLVLRYRDAGRWHTGSRTRSGVDEGPDRH